jgi:hypothetical protein
MDESDRGAGLVAQFADELDQRAHLGLRVLVAAGGLHAGERVECEQARLQIAANGDQFLLPAGVVKPDPRIRRDHQPAAQLLALDRATASERVEASPERRPAALLVREDDGARHRDVECTERRSAGGDADAQMEECIRLRRLPAADAGDERALDDQAVDEPQRRSGVGLGEQVGRVDQPSRIYRDCSGNGVPAGGRGEFQDLPLPLLEREQHRVDAGHA